jgi:hypothetical protein
MALTQINRMRANGSYKITAELQGLEAKDLMFQSRMTHSSSKVKD